MPKEDELKSGVADAEHHQSALSIARLPVMVWRLSVILSTAAACAGRSRPTLTSKRADPRRRPRRPISADFAGELHGDVPTPAPVCMPKCAPSMRASYRKARAHSAWSRGLLSDTAIGMLHPQRKRATATIAVHCFHQR